MDHQSDGDAGCCGVSLCYSSIPDPDNYHHPVAFLTNFRLFPSSTASEDGSAAYLGTGTVWDLVVKIYTVSLGPKFLQPWQNELPRETCGSGGCPSACSCLTIVISPV